MRLHKLSDKELITLCVESIRLTLKKVPLNHTQREGLESLLDFYILYLPMLLSCKFEILKSLVGVNHYLDYIVFFCSYIRRGYYKDILFNGIDKNTGFPLLVVKGAEAYSSNDTLWRFDLSKQKHSPLKSIVGHLIWDAYNPTTNVKWD